jgi:hypothetical protein
MAGGHVGRRRRQLAAQEALVHAAAALDRVGPVGGAGHGQEAGAGQDARALGTVEHHRLHGRAGDALHAVHRGQRAVDVRVRRRHQAAELAVALEHDVREEGLHLGVHGVLQVVLPLGIDHLVLRAGGHLIQVQPRAGERGDGLARLLVTQHAAGLGLDLRLGAELATGRGREQVGVGIVPHRKYDRPRGVLVMVEADVPCPRPVGFS